MVFTVMAALAQMELEITRERITGSVATRRATGKDLGGRRPTFTDSQIRNALRLIEAGEPATQVARGLGCRGRPSTAGSVSCLCRRPSEPTPVEDIEWCVSRPS
jgi:DNA invertase Pin-like site-specific DNA recombinase